MYVCIHICRFECFHDRIRGRMPWIRLKPHLQISRRKSIINSDAIILEDDRRQVSAGEQPAFRLYSKPPRPFPPRTLPRPVEPVPAVRPRFPLAISPFRVYPLLVFFFLPLSQIRRRFQPFPSARARSSPRGLDLFISYTFATALQPARLLSPPELCILSDWLGSIVAKYCATEFDLRFFIMIKLCRHKRVRKLVCICVYLYMHIHVCIFVCILVAFPFSSRLPLLQLFRSEY